MFNKSKEKEVVAISNLTVETLKGESSASTGYIIESIEATIKNVKEINDNIVEKTSFVTEEIAELMKQEAELKAIRVKNEETILKLEATLEALKEKK